jgi:uncharacterized protein YdiU (UPF0061 family)
MRGDEPSPTRSSVLVRLSHSHIRIGTFQRLAFHDDAAAIERLLDMLRLFSAPSAGPERALAFLEGRGAGRAARRRYMASASFTANSDNINVTGESFDYGP